MRRWKGVILIICLILPMNAQAARTEESTPINGTSQVKEDAPKVSEENEEIEETLETIGKKRGCLVRGGIVDYDKVYTVVMNDIKNGIIKGITFDRYE